MCIIALDVYGILTFALVKVNKIRVPVERCLPAQTVQTIILPGATVLAPICQAVDADAVPLAIEVLAEVFVCVSVQAEAKSVHLTLQEHPLVHETAIVDQCAYAVVSISTAYLSIIRHLIVYYADEVTTQVWAEAGVEFRCIGVQQVARLFVFPEVEIEIGEESLHPREEICFFLQVLSLGYELFKFLHTRDLQQKIKVFQRLSLQVGEATLCVFGNKATEGGTLDVFKLTLEVPNGEHKQFLEVFQIELHLA